jgi:hypothetical protein
VKTSQFHKKILLYKESAGLSNCLISQLRTDLQPTRLIFISALMITKSVRPYILSLQKTCNNYVPSGVISIICACLQDAVTHKRKRACKQRTSVQGPIFHRCHRHVLICSLGVLACDRSNVNRRRDLTV